MSNNPQFEINKTGKESSNCFWKQCGCIILWVGIMIIAIQNMFAAQDNNLIFNLFNDSISVKNLNMLTLNSNHSNHDNIFSKPCKLIADGNIDSTFSQGIFTYYTNDVFDITFNNTNKRGSRAFIIQSKVDIDNNINHNFRFSIGNELCFSDQYAPKHEIFGNHSILISHWYYDQKTDANPSYWKSLDPKTTLDTKPIYFPLMFASQFIFTDYEHDLLPIITNYTNYTNLWNERELMISVTHSLHTKYRRGLTTFYKKNIGTNTNYKSFVLIIRKFRHDRKGQYLNTTQYRSVLMRSKFVACVAGNNAETLRFWETLAMSAIPVLAVKHTNYLHRKCRFSYNGFLLFPNMTMENIENNGLIWNDKNWFFIDLNSSKLLQLNKSQQFVPAILLRNDYDLEPFLEFVALNEKQNSEKSKTFWNLYQKLMNEWFLKYIEHKMYKVKELMVSRMFANCSIN
eukprot:65095_1